MDTEKKKMIESETLGEKKETLMFTRDPQNENWISRLANGKIVLLHRSCDVIPWPGVEYLCTIQEKESHALSWILGMYQYPRVVVKADETCILIESPNKKPEAIEHIYDALRKINQEYAFVLYRKENKILSDDETKMPNRDMRIVDVELKLTDQTTKNALKTPFKISVKRILDLKEIADSVKEKMMKGLL